MERRLLGRTGNMSSVIAFGGAALWECGQEDADDIIEFCLDHGVNHIDVAPTYGVAELRLGPWVKEHRSSLFLACKTAKRNNKEAAEELERSLERLQTEYFDLYQLHALDDPKDLETALGPDGAMEAIFEAKEQGLVRYVGITSHRPLTILKALGDFDFDTVLLPVNHVLRAHRVPENDYEPVLALAGERNMGVIAMKSIAKGPWPSEDHPRLPWYEPFSTQDEIDQAVWFALSQQNVTTLAATSDIKLIPKMIDAAERYEPMNDAEQRELVSRASAYTPLFPRIQK